jgi:hypothetical protein
MDFLVGIGQWPMSGSSIQPEFLMGWHGDEMRLQPCKYFKKVQQGGNDESD